jgi:hypothetical protein
MSDHTSSVNSLNLCISSVNTFCKFDPFWNRTGTLTKLANIATKLRPMAVVAAKSAGVIFFRFRIKDEEFLDEFGGCKTLNEHSSRFRSHHGHRS